LREVGFVDRHFGDEVLRALGSYNVIVDCFGCLDRDEEFSSDFSEHRFGDFEGGVDTWYLQGSRVFLIRCNKSIHIGIGWDFTDEVRHIERVEITAVEEAIDCLQADVVGIDIVITGPFECSDCGVGLRAQILWLAFDNAVLSKGFIPSRVDI
jgi:hypothetical protein